MAFHRLRFQSTPSAPLQIRLPRRSRNSTGYLITFALAGVAGLLGCDQGPSIEDVRTLQANGQFAESLEPLRELLKVSPDDPEVNFRYGSALGQTTSSPVSVWSLRKAAEDPEWLVRAHMELALASYRSASMDAVIESTTAVLDAEPDHQEALQLRGMTYLNAKNEPELARHDFEAMLDIDPSNDDAKVSLASALLVLGEVEEAERLLLEIEEFARSESANETTQALLCATRATLEAERQELERAEQMLETCLELYPTDSVVVEQAVALFDQTGKADRSTQLLRETLEAAPGNTGLRESLSTRLLAIGDTAGAETALLDATKLSDPRTRIWAWSALTNFYLELDDLPAATDSYRAAMELTPNPTQLAILTFADLLARGEHHAEALKVAAALENDSYRGLIEARVHLNELRPAEALARLEQVFLTWPNNPGARYYAARAAEQLGDFTRAIEEYRQSVRSDSEQTEAGLRLAKLYLESGSLQNAWNTASQYYRIHTDDPEGIRVLLRAATVADPESVRKLFVQLKGSKQWPTALSIRTLLVEAREGPEAALALVEESADTDLNLPANVELLRTKVRLLLQLGRIDAARATLAPARAAHDGFGPFLEIQGLVLERSGAPAAEVRAAYTRATELAPNYWVARESLGRLEEREGNLDAALGNYRRAVSASPEQDAPGRAIAEALEKANRLPEAELAWEAQLREHPWDSRAALALSRLRSRIGKLDRRTLELAERSVLFQGGQEAQQLLVATHNALGETARAAAVADAIKSGKPLAPTQITPIDRL